MKMYYFEFLTIPESWVKLLDVCMREGRVYVIDRGSRKGKRRKELDLVVIQIKKPWLRPLTPHLEAPGYAPTEKEIREYYLYFVHPYTSSVEYLPEKLRHEYSYTYGEKIGCKQYEALINMLAITPNTNQAVLRVTEDVDIHMESPPCLCLLQFKVIEGRLVCYAYFRSWDLFGGYPYNVPAIQLLKEDVLDSVNRKRREMGLSEFNDGELVLISAGLHIYETEWEVVKEVLNNTLYKRR